MRRHQGRQLLLENLNDEEKGEENHPELWMRFAEGLGLGRAEVEAAELLPETKASVATIKSLTEDPDCLSGIAALYAYESQIPEVAGTKREGLKAFYGIDDARTVSFFTVHEQADLVHRRLERDILREKAADSASRHRKSCVRPMRRRRRSGRFSMASTGRSFQRSSGTSTGGVFYRGEL